MNWLIAILHMFVGATLSGVGLIAVLVMDVATPLTLAGAIAVGFILSIPISVLIARGLKG